MRHKKAPTLRLRLALHLAACMPLGFAWHTAGRNGLLCVQAHPRGGAFYRGRRALGRPGDKKPHLKEVGLSDNEHGVQGLRARSKRKLFSTTSKLAPTSANTAIHMVACPVRAITRNTALIPKARLMFCHNTACKARD